MTLSFDTKDDLRLRMADLEKKLAESEEERYKLEKTCNVLMRAFREEEKIRYKTLNKNYEKFLQDCTARKRRNDIIMRSLCRIEDRSRTLFARTERLKLLKDRYISYLKITDIKSGIPSHSWKTIPPTSLSPKTTPKFVQWKNPLASDQRVSDLQDDEENSVSISKISHVSPQDLVSQEEKINQYSNDLTTNAFVGVSLSQAPDSGYDPQNKLGLGKTKLGSPLGNTFMREELTIDREKPVNKKHSIELGVKDIVEDSVSKEKNNWSHQGSIEKLKKVFSFEEKLLDNENNEEEHDPYDEKAIEKNYIKKSEKNTVKMQNYSQDKYFPNHKTMTSSLSIFEEEKQEGEEDFELETAPTEGNLPMGLDGVDYQNETYPESYYEQPVHHHNHTSIVADVILEEDETEQEENIFNDNQLVTEDDNNNTLGEGSWKDSPRHRGDKTPDNLQQNWTNEANNKEESPGKVHDFINEKDVDESKSQESEPEKPLEEKSLSVDGSEPKTGKSEKLSEENLESKKNVRSNLIHLLESDSESFQIEHGDAVSGNEDSDFDFSFH